MAGICVILRHGVRQRALSCLVFPRYGKDEIYEADFIANDVDEVQSYVDYAFNLEKLEKEVLMPIKENGYIDREITLLI